LDIFGLSSKSARTIAELASEFGLFDDLTCYREIDAITAQELIERILNRDMAYNTEVMAAALATRLAKEFFRQFDGGNVRFFSNQFPFVSESKTFTSWWAATQATFDTGVLVIGARIAGCLWVEDED
jgi:phenylalanyl-tRNA synthetase alpha subunit